MPEITENLVRALARIASAASYGYHQVRIERRPQYGIGGPEITVYVLGNRSEPQTWRDARLTVAFMLGCIQAAQQTRDDFQLTTEEQSTVDTAAAEVPEDYDQATWWVKYGDTLTRGVIKGVQAGQLTDATMWDARQVAAYLGIDLDSVRRQMSRWSIRRADVEESASGRTVALYPAAAVRETHAARPGRGARTDLTKRPCS